MSDTKKKKIVWDKKEIWKPLMVVILLVSVLQVFTLKPEEYVVGLMIGAIIMKFLMRRWKGKVYHIEEEGEESRPW